MKNVKTNLCRYDMYRSYLYVVAVRAVLGILPKTKTRESVGRDRDVPMFSRHQFGRDGDLYHNLRVIAFGRERDFNY